MQEIIEGILTEELPSNIYTYGFADLNNLLSTIYKDYQYGISLMRKLDDEIIDEISEGPTLKYWNHYKEINNELREKVIIIANLLKSKGIEAIGISSVEDDERDDNYEKYLRYRLSHKMVATRAGFGWIGKTDLFISKKYGPRIRLASILINSKVQSKDMPLNESLCGICSVCVDFCPAKAANGKLWNISTDRDEYFDAFKCRDNCVKLTTDKIGKDERLCGICVSLCPRGKLNKVVQ